MWLKYHEIKQNVTTQIVIVYAKAEIYPEYPHKLSWFNIGNNSLCYIFTTAEHRFYSTRSYNIFQHWQMVFVTCKCNSGKMHFEGKGCREHQSPFTGLLSAQLAILGSRPFKKYLFNTNYVYHVYWENLLSSLLFCLRFHTADSPGHQMCVVPPHQVILCDTSWVFSNLTQHQILSIWRWCQSPWAKGSVPQDCSHCLSVAHHQWW